MGDSSAPGRHNRALDGQLIEQGRGIIDELELGSSTEKWMAHHVAGLMERASSARAKAERAEAAAQCAALISKLWERRGNGRRQQTLERLEHALQALRQDPSELPLLVKAMERRRAGSALPRLNAAQKWELLYEANHAERRLAYLGACASGAIERDDLGDGLAILIVDHLRDEVAKVFPELKGLDLKRRQVSVRAVKAACRELSALRQQLLG